MVPVVQGEQDEMYPRKHETEHDSEAHDALLLAAFDLSDGRII